MAGCTHSCAAIPTTIVTTLILIAVPTLTQPRTDTVSNCKSHYDLQLFSTSMPTLTQPSTDSNCESRFDLQLFSTRDDFYLFTNIFDFMPTLIRQTQTVSLTMIYSYFPL